MFKPLTTALIVSLTCSVLAAQPVPTATDLEHQVAELRRQIDVLSGEIERLKSGEKAEPPRADSQQFGLGAAASKVYRAQPGVSIGGYGEMLYENRNGAPDTADFLRAVVYTGYKFNDRALFNSEIEVEHGSTEAGGAVSVEFGYLDFLTRPDMGVRAGLVLIPMGFINEQHEPTAFLGARRTLIEQAIIPATWSELGAGLFGESHGFSYRGYVVTGLNGAHFSSEGIREGRGAGAEAPADDFAVTGRLDWQPAAGTMLGGSLYLGNAGQDSDADARVTLGDLHAEGRFRGFALRALLARGSIGDAARLNDINGLSGSESVGKTFGGWYGEAGYDLAALWPHGEMSLMPFVRHERLGTQRSVPAGFLRDPAREQTITTLGVNFKPFTQTVIKADYQKVRNRARTGRNQFNLAVGYIF